MTEQNTSFKSGTIEENLIKHISRFITFQHLKKSFMRHAYTSPGEYM